MDVYIWLLYRKSGGKTDLQRVGNYVIGNTAERQDFEKFRNSSFYQNRPFLKTSLLLEFMKQKQISPIYTSAYGQDFITNFPRSLLDDLCLWAREHLHGDSGASHLHQGIITACS